MFLKDLKALFLALLFVVGWVFPKINFYGLNTGIQDVIVIIIILYLFGVRLKKKDVYSLVGVDLFFLFIFFIYSIIGLIYGDYVGLVIAVRSISFCVASLIFIVIERSTLRRTLIWSVMIVFVIVLWQIVVLIEALVFEKTNLPLLLFGDGEYRVRDITEPEGSASSQIPIGYLLSFLVILLVSRKKRLITIVLTIGTILTTSRSAVLSLVSIFYLRKSSFVRKVFFGILGIGLISFLFSLKTFSSEFDGLDGSSKKRLELYTAPFNYFYNYPIRLIVGSGVSSDSLLKYTGEGFYESFPINSLMQGGLLLCFMSLYVLYKRAAQFFYNGFIGLSLVIIIGNFVGGSNYFSIYTYPMMILIFTYIRDE